MNYMSTTTGVKPVETTPTVDPNVPAVLEPVVAKDEFYEIDIDREIDDVLFKALYKKIQLNFDKKPVKINIFTPGGEITPGMVLIDLLKSMGTKLVGISYHTCSSMGTVFMSIPDTRLCYPSSKFMMHGPYLFAAGSPLEITDKLAVKAKEQEVYTAIFEERIGLTKKELTKIFQYDHWYTAEEALNLGTNGLINGIIQKHIKDNTYEILTRNGVVELDIYKDDLIIK